ncbi:hypothetical protein [Limosilactobacillus coleohominis]|uniref:Uncharacterized protein n=1 Tax=Limosilactobacillus coleohominis TaxID=181675 RepID=A0ABS2GY86_9LACO|nr:hypothetical protein [Limosilactobacillus coleohominis]MCI5813038.1 hypothetical protein [Lactobacillus sp.]HJA22742.1 hypothetical protein [Candidatus Limosilactobacillus intestinavium]MBM6941242.1 hypothetical protein [Limosilactobacillus coleohominis]MBM6954087.1 hypothetical protein [Limosilactobacillus coleohominis]MDY3702725.1 hypothetical protein [Limosilactobacillus coleohominis]
MSLLITILIIWLLWKLLKFSFWLLGLLLIVALVGFFVKALLIPAVIILGGGLLYGLGSFLR